MVNGKYAHPTGMLDNYTFFISLNTFLSGREKSWKMSNIYHHLFYHLLMFSWTSSAREPLLSIFLFWGFKFYCLSDELGFPVC